MSTFAKLLFRMKSALPVSADCNVYEWKKGQLRYHAQRLIAGDYSNDR